MLSLSTAPEAQILLSPTPQCHLHNAFVEDPTNLRVGVWDSTPYTRQARPHKRHELMHLIEGSVTFHSPEGASLQVNTDDSVFVPLGAVCAWESTTYVRKFYAVK